MIGNRLAGTDDPVKSTPRVSFYGEVPRLSFLCSQRAEGPGGFSQSLENSTEDIRMEEEGVKDMGLKFLKNPA